MEKQKYPYEFFQMPRDELLFFWRELSRYECSSCPIPKIALMKLYWILKNDDYIRYMFDCVCSTIYYSLHPSVFTLSRYKTEISKMIRVPGALPNKFDKRPKKLHYLSDRSMYLCDDGRCFTFYRIPLDSFKDYRSKKEAWIVDRWLSTPYRTSKIKHVPRYIKQALVDDYVPEKMTALIECMFTESELRPARRNFMLDILDGLDMRTRAYYECTQVIMHLSRWQTY